MKCLKTGAQVYIQELGAIYPADVYGVGPDTLIVRLNPKGKQECWFKEEAAEQGATHSVLIGNPLGQDEDWVRDDLGVVVCLRANFEGELVE